MSSCAFDDERQRWDINFWKETFHSIIWSSSVSECLIDSDSDSGLHTMTLALQVIRKDLGRIFEKQPPFIKHTTISTMRIHACSLFVGFKLALIQPRRFIPFASAVPSGCIPRVPAPLLSALASAPTILRSSNSLVNSWFNRASSLTSSRQDWRTAPRGVRVPSVPTRRVKLL
jgi:hypothetical protein